MRRKRARIRVYGIIVMTAVSWYDQYTAEAENRKEKIP